MTSARNDGANGAAHRAFAMGFLPIGSTPQGAAGPLLRRLSALVACAFICAQGAAAADASTESPAPETGLPEITVTAEKVRSTVQDTPSASPRSVPSN